MAPPSAAPDPQEALLAEAATKSGLLWVDVPGDRAWPAWHVWVDGAAYVVSGPGEQTLPELPESVVLVLRSKDTGGRLLRVAARAERLRPEDPRWEPATTALKAARLNAPAGDVVGALGRGGDGHRAGAAAAAARGARRLRRRIRCGRAGGHTRHDTHLAPVAPEGPPTAPSGHPLSRDATAGTAG